MNINPAVATIVSVCFTFLTFMALGWYLVLIGIFILISLVLQIILIWKLHDMDGTQKMYLTSTLTSFVLLCLFREDFGDTANSAISPTSLLSKFLGLRDSARYKEVSLFGAAINFLWFAQLIAQTFGLIKFR